MLNAVFHLQPSIGNDCVTAMRNGFACNIYARMSSNVSCNSVTVVSTVSVKSMALKVLEMVDTNIPSITYIAKERRPLLEDVGDCIL